MECYLDNSATTRCFEEAAKLAYDISTGDFGNPSSMHMKGVEAEKYLREAKETIATILKVNSEDIYFTSGATESDNTAIFGVAKANERRGKHLITTCFEHPAVLAAFENLEKQGFEVTYLEVDEKGQISLDALKNAIRQDTTLVSVMHTNNEIGAVQPIEEIGKLIKSVNPNTYFHVDAVQGFGKAFIYPKRANIDLMAVSSHKIHGPKGVGFLYIKDNVKINPLIFGGGQQMDMRPGTENVAGIAAMALAAKKLYANMDTERDKLFALRKRFIDGLSQIEGTYVQASGFDADMPGFAPHIVSAAFKDIRSEVMLHMLEDKGIYTSAGSACSTHKRAASKTLIAIKAPRWSMESTLRFSFSVFTTEEEIDYTLQTLKEVIPVLSRYTRKK